MAGAALGDEVAEGFGGFEIEGNAQRIGGVAEQAALKSQGLGGEADHVQGDRLARFGSTASPANRLAGEEQLRGETSQLRLPVGFLFAGEFCHGGKMLADAGIPLLEFRKQLMTQAVASEG